MPFDSVLIFEGGAATATGEDIATVRIDIRYQIDKYIAAAAKQLTTRRSPMNSNLEFSHKSQTVTVSRSTVFPEDGRFTPDGEVLARLEELLRAGFDSGCSPIRKRKKRAHSVGGRPESIENIESARKSRLLSSLLIYRPGVSEQSSQHLDSSLLHTLPKPYLWKQDPYQHEREFWYN